MLIYIISVSRTEELQWCKLNLRFCCTMHCIYCMFLFIQNNHSIAQATPYKLFQYIVAAYEDLKTKTKTLSHYIISLYDVIKINLPTWLSEIKTTVLSVAILAKCITSSDLILFTKSTMPFLKWISPLPHYYMTSARGSPVYGVFLGSLDSSE